MYFFVLALLSLAGCGAVTGASDFAVPRIDGGGPPGPGPLTCDSFCVRPADCQIAYPDVDRCPAGFRCSRDFRCPSDGGGSD